MPFFSHNNFIIYIQLVRHILLLAGFYLRKTCLFQFRLCPVINLIFLLQFKLDDSSCNSSVFAFHEIRSPSWIDFWLNCILITYSSVWYTFVVVRFWLLRHSGFRCTASGESGHASFRLGEFVRIIFAMKNCGFATAGDFCDTYIGMSCEQNNCTEMFIEYEILSRVLERELAKLFTRTEYMTSSRVKPVAN